MLSYVYDGTYAGMLSCLHDAIRKSEDPELIADEEAFTPGLFDRALRVETQASKVAWTKRFLGQRLTPESEPRLFRAFLADVPGREMCIYRYVRRGMTQGKKLDTLLTDPAVRAVHDLSRTVGCEAHRLNGFVRFQELSDGQFYAPICPDHFVLPLVAAFFSRRLPRRAWIIHDTKRRAAAIHDAGRWIIAGFAVSAPLKFSAAELECRRLWRDYFQRIAISSRRNLKLQQQHVPLRYRPFMVEFTADGV